MDVTPTFAVGLDVVLAVDPAVYEIEEDARGRAYAFRMDADAVADAVRSAVAAHGDEHDLTPRDIAALDIEPGYVRLRIEPVRGGVSPAVARALRRRVPDYYNDRHADHAAAELAFGDYYASTYRPDNVPDRAAFLERYTCEAAPEHDEPLIEREREAPYAQSDHSYLAYRVTVPFAPGAYQRGDSQRFAFEWDDVARERFASIIEDRPRWPSTTTRVAVYPQYVVAEIHGAGLANPAHVAGGVADAVTGYNRARGEHPDLGSAGQTHLKPKIDVAKAAYIEGVEVSGATADAYIADRELEAVTGDAVDRELEDAPSADAGGWMDRLSPFGGGST